MAADREPKHDLNDAEFERLLKLGYQPAPLSEEFAESLQNSLRQEFEYLPLSPNCDSQPAVGPAVSTNGSTSAVASKGTVNGEHCPVVFQQREAQADIPSSEAHPSARGLRIAITMLAAASLLLAVSLWNERQAYGWSHMLDALKQTGWIQATAAEDGLNGWFSSSRQVVAMKRNSETVFENHQTRTQSVYYSEHQTIVEQSLTAGDRWSAERHLVALLTGSEPSENLQVVDESWQWADGRDRGESLVELVVTLQAKPPNSELLRVVLLLDPDTQLPVSAQIVGQNETTREIDFRYPENGPESIFALGIPRETEVISTRQQLAATAEQKIAVTEQPRRSIRVEDPGKNSPPGQRIVVQELVTVGEEKKPAEEPPLPQSTEQASGPRETTTVAAAIEALPQPLGEEELVDLINHELATFWQDQGIRPAEPATDEEFLRRVYLDLMGRIPMVSEAYEFLEDGRPDRRARLVDNLLQRRDHATHLASVWRRALLPDGLDVGAYGGAAKFDQWLADRFGENVPYDRLVRDLLLAEGRVSESGPLLFYAALKLNPEEIAAKTSRTFLGMRMECAQCHDHPFDMSISQEDFWGFAAFFAQISRPQGKMEMTSSVLRVRDNRRGEVMIPETDQVVPPQLPGTDRTIAEETDSPPRRRQLVDWLTSSGNARFAEAAVNRVWQHLFGRGFVAPVDDMRPDNQPICPELFHRLSRDFAASGFDLRRLLRAIVLSDAYQLSSRTGRDDPSQSLAFARMNIKSFTADQLYDCIAVATQNQQMIDHSTAEGTLARLNNGTREKFVEQFRAPPGERTDYQAGIPQALTIMNGNLIHGSTAAETSGLLQSLKAPFFTDEQRTDTLFLAALSRFPEEHEQQQILDFIKSAANDAERQAAWGDVLWALLNSAEFTFIH